MLKTSWSSFSLGVIIDQGDLLVLTAQGHVVSLLGVAARIRKRNGSGPSSSAFLARILVERPDEDLLDVVPVVPHLRAGAQNRLERSRDRACRPCSSDGTKICLVLDLGVGLGLELDLPVVDVGQIGALEGGVAAEMGLVAPGAVLVDSVDVDLERFELGALALPTGASSSSIAPGGNCLQRCWAGRAAVAAAVRPAWPGLPAILGDRQAQPIATKATRRGDENRLTSWHGLFPLHAFRPSEPAFDTVAVVPSTRRMSRAKPTIHRFRPPVQPWTVGILCYPAVSISAVRGALVLVFSSSASPPQHEASGWLSEASRIEEARESVRMIQVQYKAG